MLGFKRWHSHQRGTTWLILSLLVITLYQNCDGQLSTKTEGLSQAGNPAQSGTLGPNGTIIDPAIRLAACKSVNKTPKITSIPATEVTIMSGAATGSGDQASTSITYSVNDGVTDTRVATEHLCNFATNFTCTLIADATHPITLTSAVDTSGAQVAASTTTDAARLAVLRKAFNTNNGNCAGAIDAATKTKDVALRNNRNANNNDFFRCVQGSVWVQIVAGTQIDNEDPVDSAPVYLKVNLQNSCWNESRLVNSAEAFGKFVNFGGATAIDGTWAAIVAPRDNSGSITSTGALYMFQQSAGKWNYTQKILISDAAAGDSLTSVAISGGKLAVSSEKRGNRGAVFIYVLSGGTWSLSQVINPPMNQDAQKFGQSLAMTATSLVVGAPDYSISGAANRDQGGAVYAFSCTANSCTYRYAIQSPEPGRGYGTSVALSGNTLVIGAPQALTQEPDGKGFVDIFDISGAASLSKRLTPADGAPGMRYGASVAISAGKILVGAPNKTNGNSNESGAAYYYATSASAPVIKSSGTASANLGKAVAFSTNGILVGCPACNAGAGEVSYYTFANTTNNPDFRVFGLNRSNNDGFGFSIAVSGSNLAVGANIKSDPNANSGASYIYLIK